MYPQREDLGHKTNTRVSPYDKYVAVGGVVKDLCRSNGVVTVGIPYPSPLHMYTRSPL